METCNTCGTATTQLPPDAVSYCPMCERVVEAGPKRMGIKKWRLSTNSQGETSILGPPLARGEKLFVVDLRALLEMMSIIDRQMVRLGGPPPYAETIRHLSEDLPEEWAGGFDVA